MQRGTGKTTDQLYNAPNDAIYVGVNLNHINVVCRDIARRLKREDIRFVPPSWIADSHLQGLDRRINIVLDHAAILNGDQIMSLFRFWRLSC